MLATPIPSGEGYPTLLSDYSEPFLAQMLALLRRASIVLVPLQKIVGIADNFLQRHKNKLVDAVGIDQT
ncbi:hypothetical protein KDA_07240 [Dictyobacter alpinus]|uniref:Uncharacterized protein n=1 Tax=Dictyobacter alpinus TaxID=2014873 RepID=A0A402B1J3_9CHLR|nr:hypothetical protein KDA_07240 [Dictyobacter alpinus]